MAYRVINGAEYLVREGQSRGRFLHVGSRNRGLDAGLLVDTIADKREDPVELVGPAAEDRFFTIAEADALMATLRAGNVTVTGDAGAYTARARDIGWVDVQDHSTSPPTVYRWVSAVLEEV